MTADADFFLRIGFLHKKDDDVDNWLRGGE